MNKITKKTIKRIKAGYHDDLMEAIEFLIDSYDEDKYEAGYKCRIDDEAVVAYRLAEHILNCLKEKTLTVVVDKKGNGNIVLESDDLAKVIEEYYTEALKQE